MNRLTIWFSLLLLLLANAMSVGQAQAADAMSFSKPPITLSAARILPENLLEGENFKVEDRVLSDGLINTYKLNTDYGPLRVESTAELLTRISELNALVIMEEMDRKGVFGDALVSGVTGTVKGVGELVTSPIDTTKNIVKGTGQFISNIGQSIFSDDPDQDNVVKTALGYDAAKRKFAFEFGIDPYTDYDPVADRLGEVARAAVAGGLAPRAAMAAIDSPVVMAMQISGTAYGMMQLVRDNPPAKLREINRKKLQAMGVDDQLIEAFLDNYRYNPQEKTILVGELDTMKGVKGLDRFVGQAALATEETLALVFRVRAQMMAGYHLGVAPIARILNIDGVLSAQLKNGKLVLLVPVDYVFWTQPLANKVKSFEANIAKMEGISGKELWISGKFDNSARTNFEASGWQVKEDANTILLKRK